MMFVVVRYEDGTLYAGYVADAEEVLDLVYDTEKGGVLAMWCRITMPDGTGFTHGGYEYNH